jgi:hypothetical protein
MSFSKWQQGNRKLSTENGKEVGLQRAVPAAEHRSARQLEHMQLSYIKVIQWTYQMYVSCTESSRFGVNVSRSILILSYYFNHCLHNRADAELTDKICDKKVVCQTDVRCLSLLTYLLRGTTALTGTSRRYYGSIAWVSAYEEQVANLLPQHRFSNQPDSRTRAIW